MKASPQFSRRDFLKTSAAATVGTLGCTNFAWGQSASDTIRVGLIGCGGRGSGAAVNCANSAPGVEIVGMADLFRDRLTGARNNLKKELKDKFKVTNETSYVGFDAYKELLASDVNYVILATPPGFRPIHFEAAVAAGKNIFFEKPVAVDPVGVRKVIAASEVAAQKKLAVVAGTQRRHQNSYIETIKRIREGAIGDVIWGEIYWNQGLLWVNKRQPKWTDMEYQCRNWYYFTWLGGDHIVEQHIHQHDVMNWIMGGPPAKVYGSGGREVRTGEEFGHIFDHFQIEYEYPNGVRIFSSCRQQDGTVGRVDEFIKGTKGTSGPGGWIAGEKRWNFAGANPDAYKQEHTDNIEALRAGKPLNEGRQVAESTLTAIMGRMAAYTGQEVTWDFALNKSKLDLSPPSYNLDQALPVPPVAVPGQTKLI